MKHWRPRPPAFSYVASPRATAESSELFSFAPVVRARLDWFFSFIERSFVHGDIYLGPSSTWTPSPTYRPMRVKYTTLLREILACNTTGSVTTKSRRDMLTLAVVLLSLPSSVSAGRRAGGEGAGRHEHAARPGGSLISWSQSLPDVPRLWTPDMQPHPPATTNQTCRRGALKMCRDARGTGVQYGQPCPKELHEICLVPQEYISTTRL